MYQQLSTKPSIGLCMASPAYRNQISQEDLITENRFRESALILEDVAANHIQQFELIPDNKTATKSPYPKLVRTAAGYICVNGWNMVADALRIHQLRIRCRVKYLRDASQIDLAIIKTGIGFLKKDSTNYAELAANLKRLLRLVEETTITPMIFTYGCSRTAGQSDEGQERDFVALLAEFLKEKTSDIENYIHHTNYLPDELLNELVEKGTGKMFFLRLACRARTMKLRLQQQRIDPADIENQISLAVEQMTQAYIESGNEVFTATAKRIYAEFAPPMASSTVTAEIQGPTENGGESGESRNNETSSENAQIPPPESQSCAQPCTEPSGGDQDEVDEENRLLPEVANDSDGQGLGNSTIEQIKVQYAVICLNTSAKLVPLTELHLIEGALQQHRIEVARIQTELVKMHRQLAGR